MMEETQDCFTYCVPSDSDELVWWAVCAETGVWRIHATDFDRIGYLIETSNGPGIGDDFFDACDAVAIHLEPDDPKAACSFRKLHDYFH